MIRERTARAADAHNIAMALKLLIILTLFTYISSQSYNCNQKSALLLLKRPAYDFSTRILDRAAQNEHAHFVFSPLSTWLQLTALAEGATGKTLREIWKMTRHHRNRCFKTKLAKILHKINRGLKYEFRRNSVMVLDELLAVKKNYVRDIQKFYGIRVMLENFAYPYTAADEVNKYVEAGTDGVISDAVFGDDFNATVMLLSDNVYFRSAWLTPFNSAYTKPEVFLSSAGVEIGEVNMMNQIGYFNMATLPKVNAKVLEIPCVSGVSMLLFLPTKDIWVGDIFYDLQRTTLNSIFNIFKSQGPKIVNVKVPRFTVNTSVDNLPELIADMGVRRVFDPNRSELGHISEYVMYASLMSQIADIEVTERGVRATATAENLVNDTVNDTEEFVANRPFAFVIADRKTQFILFAGAYSVPSKV